jgi:hypothetical protein
MSDQLKSRVATYYQHTQSTPATVWTIVHKLNDYPIIEVYADVSGVLTKIIPSSISYVDSITATVTFATARSGVALVS